MQEIQILKWCDRHFHYENSQRVTARAVNLSLPGMADRELDLCDECITELIMPLAEVTRAYSRPTEVVKPTRSRKKAASEKASAQSVAQSAGEDTLFAQDGTQSAGAAALSPELLPLPNGSRPKRGGRPSSRSLEERGVTAIEIPGGFECPECPSRPVTYGAFRQHVKVRHDLTATDLFGATCPLCAETFTGAGLSRHVQNQHSQATPYHAFRTAMSQGDPHGVVAGLHQGWLSAA